MLGFNDLGKPRTPFIPDFEYTESLSLIQGNSQFIFKNIMFGNLKIEIVEHRGKCVVQTCCKKIKSGNLKIRTCEILKL